MPKSITIAFQTDKPLSAYGPLAARAEDYGFDGVTVYNDMLYQPAWLPLMEIAKATKRVRIGAAAVNPFTSHPVNLAANIALVDEASQGRAYLGIARGGWLDFVGIQPKRVVTALKESFAAVRHLLSQSKDPLPGEIFPVAGGDAFRWSILRPNIPFLLGSWGEKTLRGMSPYINEVKIGGSANPDVSPWMRGLIAQHAPRPRMQPRRHRYRRRRGDGGRRRRARRPPKGAREVALYLPVIAELDPTVQIEPDRMDRIKAAAARYDFEAAAAAVSDEILATIRLRRHPGRDCGADPRHLRSRRRPRRIRHAARDHR
ncbi:MAG: LLM class flavin-dependent oxidoreductase [Caldilineaceae bacterium]